MALVLITVGPLLHFWCPTKSCFIDIKSVPNRTEYHCCWDVIGIWILVSACSQKYRYSSPTFHIEIYMQPPPLGYEFTWYPLSFFSPLLTIIARSLINTTLRLRLTNPQDKNCKSKVQSWTILYEHWSDKFSEGIQVFINKKILHRVFFFNRETTSVVTS